MKTLRANALSTAVFSYGNLIPRRRYGSTGYHWNRQAYLAGIKGGAQ